MRPVMRSDILSLLCLFLLVGKAETLQMTVQVTVVPKATKKLPLCSSFLLQTLQSYLTYWVIKATKESIPDFAMPGLLTLTYRNPIHGRMLGTPSQRGRAYPSSCTTCNSAGCSQYCGKAICELCASSRRLTSDGMPVQVEEEDHENRMRELYKVDFVAVGKQVSAAVQNLAQTFLLTHVFDILGCLGNPSYLTTNVTFLPNQIFTP